MEEEEEEEREFQGNSALLLRFLLFCALETKVLAPVFLHLNTPFNLLVFVASC